MFVAFANSLAVANPRNAPPYPGANQPSAPGLPKVRYEYRYAVDDPASGVVSQRWEHRLGEYVKGAYSLVEPDGSVRHVDYEVDGEKGFHAVVRTSPPVNTLLSADQLSKSRQSHRQPPVNVLTNHPEAAASASVSAEVSAGRGGRRLPINFHSVRPDYYLAFAKGEPARYRESTPALELPLETPAEVEEQAAPLETISPPPPPRPPPPAPAPAPAPTGPASSHHHHLAGLHAPGTDYSTLRALLGPPAAPLLLPRGRALGPPPRPAGGPALGYPSHTEAIFQPYPPITLAADLFAG
ncbi:hypothetical protein R5R35_008307 [Gryllus longicercus]|uniref:Cuticular protein n=1 Tax=Gryllus longicercus TaxID=2509291 RepID=A0AAN9Z683_9ORTH